MWLAPALASAQVLRVTSIDIGQGDSTVVVAPGGCAALFDGGPTGSGSTIKGYLRSIGVTRLEMAFTSHFHADHLGGLDEVDMGTDAVPITTVYDRGGSYSSSAFTEYANRFSSRRRTVAVGQTFSLCNQVTLRVVAVNGNGVSTTDENALSVAVKVSYGQFDALIGGDLTSTIEPTLTSSIGEIELYKVHHHGSQYSSSNTLLDATRPLVSFISVGVGNSYGHPTQACLDRLAAHGSDIWQTEDPATSTLRGHIRLTSADGNSFTVTQGSQSVSYTSKGVSDTQPPTAPGSLVATAASSSEVDLSWLDSTDDVGVTDYRVYRSGDGVNFALVGTLASPGFADLGLTAGATYWYQVTAIDAAGNESAPSDTVSVTLGQPARVILNEILANEPGSNTGAELVEVVNVGGSPADLSGYTVRDATAVRHTFAAGTVLQPGQAIVVFASASAIPAGLTNAVAASTGALSLNNGGDTVSVQNGATVVDSFTYGSSLAAVDGVSMNRSPDASAAGGFVLHTSLSSLSASPGTRASGAPF